MLENWCYKYLGYNRQSREDIEQVRAYCETHATGKKLVIQGHHFGRCFFEDDCSGLAKQHRCDVCQAGPEYVRDGSHAKLACLPVPSEKPADFMATAIARAAVRVPPVASSAPARPPVARSLADQPTPVVRRAAAAAGPQRFEPGVHEQPVEERPGMNESTPAWVAGLPNPTYLSSHEKRSFLEMLGPAGDLAPDSQQRVARVVSQGITAMDELEVKLQNVTLQLRMAHESEEKKRQDNQKLTDDLGQLRADLQKIQTDLAASERGRLGHVDDLAAMRETNSRLEAALKTEQDGRAQLKAECDSKYAEFQKDLDASRQRMLKFDCFLPLADGGDRVHHKHCRQLTGMPSAASLVSFYELMNEDGRCERLSFYRNPDAAFVKPEQRKMTPQDAFVYTLVLIKTGLDFEIAEVTCGIPPSTGGRYFVQWVRALTLFLQKMFPHPTREQVQACMPKRWVDVYGSDFIRLIIDGVLLLHLFSIPFISYNVSLITHS
jgi:hypothetical protein